MPLVRMLVSWGLPAGEVRDRLSNTLYFNVSGSVDPPNYQSLATDLCQIYANQSWCGGAKIEVKAYNMADNKPRPEKAYATLSPAGTWGENAHQVAVALSYYADRNLPRQRGRIFTGPWTANTKEVSNISRNNLIAFAQSLAGLGGLNVDWSVYSPTNNTNTRISNVWVDNSWDVVRSRKVRGTARSTATING